MHEWETKKCAYETKTDLRAGTEQHGLLHLQAGTEDAIETSFSNTIVVTNFSCLLCVILIPLPSSLEATTTRRVGREDDLSRDLTCHLSTLAYGLEDNQSDRQSDMPDSERAEKLKRTFLAQAERQTFPNHSPDDAECDGHYMQVI